MTDFEDEDEEENVTEGTAEQGHDWGRWWPTDAEVIEARRHAVVTDLNSPRKHRSSKRHGKAQINYTSTNNSHP